jgi:hypothetical protein
MAMMLKNWAPGRVSILAARHADFWTPSFGRLEGRGSRDIEVHPFFRWVRAGTAGAQFWCKAGQFCGSEGTTRERIHASPAVWFTECWRASARLVGGETPADFRADV